MDLLINELKSEKGILILDVKTNYETKEIKFAVIGKSLSKEEISQFKQDMNQMGYEGCSFKVFQDAGNIETINKIDDIQNSFLSNQQLLVKKDADLLEKDREIFTLKNQLTIKNNAVFPFNQIAKEIKALNAEVEEVAYSNSIVTNFENTDTIPTFEIKWNKKIATKKKIEETKKLQNWLQAKLKNDKIIVK
ncbi:MAG: hypothetical protein HC854_00435 [Flavobacterium sp.]|nr:hypothetical protein [Flavobacterium sp.]